MGPTRSPRRFRADERAASPLVAFTVAAGLFGVIAFSLALAQLELRRDDAEPAHLAGIADNALGLLLSGEGLPATWGATDAAADAVSRLGLLEGPRTVRIAESKLARFHGAGLDAAANGKVDYAEARAALGLSSHQFHLRTMPVFDPFAGGYFGVEGLDTTRLAYVGDYTSNGATETAASAAEGAILDPFPLLYANTRFLPSQVAPGGDKFPDHKPDVERHLVLRLAGWLRTEHLVTPDSAGTHTWHLLDNGNLAGIPAGAGGARVVAMGSATSPGYGAAESDRLVSPAVDVRGMASPRLVFREYIDGECVIVAGACVTPLDFATIEVSAGGPLPVWTPLASSATSWTTGGAWRTRTIDLAGCGPCAAGPVHLGFRWTSSATTHNRGWVIDDVVVSDAATGKVAWSNAMEFESSYYRILVVGSNVDQNGLNEDTIKFRLRDWVLAGGNLFVLGSTAKSDNWMQPIFGAGLGSAATATAFTPDPTHPILTTPNQLAYASYPRDGGVWRIADNHKAKFAQVVGVVPGGKPPDRDDILSVSYPKGYGNGTVILTTYLPYQMSATEAAKLLANFLMYGRYTVLYLDYGPAVPPGVEVATATRLVLAPKTVDPIGPKLEMRVILQVWRG